MKKLYPYFAILFLIFSSCGSQSEDVINDVPNAVNDAASTNKNFPVNIKVLANDTFGNDGPNSKPISTPSSTSANGGSVVINEEGTINNPIDDTIDYTPKANFEGTDTFEYTIKDKNGDSSTAIVTVTVLPTTGAPEGTTFDDDKFKYTIINVANKEVSVQKMNTAGPTGILNLPQTIDKFDVTYKVTRIPDEGFAYCYNITSVVIPSGLKSIGKLAFYDDYAITSMNIADSVTNIDNDAFGKCTSLKDFKIPSGISHLSNGVFASCKSIASINIPNTITSIGNAVFYDCSSLNNVTIPDSVLNENMGSAVFGLCVSLTNVTFPSSFTKIPNETFYACNNLQSYTIPSNITTIGASAFYECSVLKEIIIPPTVTSIGHLPLVCALILPKLLFQIILQVCLKTCFMNVQS